MSDAPTLGQQKTRAGSETLRIKQRLLALGLSVADLGRQIERPRETVSRVIHGRQKSSRVRDEVLEALGL